MSSNLQMMKNSLERMSHIQSATVPVGKTKLLDQMRRDLRFRCYSRRMEKAWCQ